MRMIFIALFFVGIASAEELPKRFADCIYNTDGECALRYVLPPNLNYRLQQFNVSDKRWQVVGPVEQGSAVEPGYFYRVAACWAKHECHYSTLFWAPIVMDEKDIPDEVTGYHYDPEGRYEEIAYGISKDWPRHSQLGQLNVYVMTGQLRLIMSDINGRMSKPAPHVDDGSLAGHDENIIHHNVYTEYTEARKYLFGDGTDNLTAPE